MTDDVLYYSGIVLAGMVLGMIFFGGLWLTVQRMPTSRHPALLFLISLITRMAIVLGGFWLITKGAPGAVLACLAGFFVVRLLATSKIRVRDQNTDQRDQRTATGEGDAS